MKEKMFLILDSNSILHRSFHALPPFVNSKREPTGAIYGFLSILWKIINKEKPDFIAACFDSAGPTLRHKEFKKYKAKRPPLDPKLGAQIEKTKELLKILSIPVFEKEGLEADDIIGIISNKILRKQIYPKIKVKIVTGDRDLFQLIDKNVSVLFMKTGVKDFIEYDSEKVREEYEGIRPEQIPDFKALRGDPSDNIPGVTGIGRKTAISLLKEFKGIEDIYSALHSKSDKVNGIKETIRELLINQESQAFLSKSLANIRKDDNLEFRVDDCKWGNYDKNKFIVALSDLGFKSLIKRFFSNTEKDKRLDRSKQANLFTD